MYHFDSYPDRKNLGSLKWERYADKSILPLWVADMDFEAAYEIIQRLKHDPNMVSLDIPFPMIASESVIQYLSKSHSYEVKKNGCTSYLDSCLPSIFAVMLSLKQQI